MSSAAVVIGALRVNLVDDSVSFRFIFKGSDTVSFAPVLCGDQLLK